MTEGEPVVSIGAVGRPHGLDGAFIVERASTNEGRWRVGTTVLVDGQPATVELSRRVGGGRRAIRLDRAVPRGAELTVSADNLPAPEPDTYYVFQLVGLQVVDESGASLGHVKDVHSGVANDNVELDDGTLVPLVEDAIRDVDLAGGRLVVSRGFLG